LGPPRDGDHSSREDGMIAEVIPLRRRTPDHGSSPDEEPAHSGLFDPPPDPEPPEEYSVWERPTAELLRRERPDDRVPTRRRGWATAAFSRRAQVPAILGTLVARWRGVDIRLPDFTVRVGGKTFYWEHCGMMDDPAYRAKWQSVRLPWYKKHGFEDQLIVTLDGEEDPIDSGKIEAEIVKGRILNS